MKKIRSIAGIVVLGLLAMGRCRRPRKGESTSSAAPIRPGARPSSESFSKATGIQTEFVRLSSGAALRPPAAPRRTRPLFDVWFGGQRRLPVGGAGRRPDRSSSSRRRGELRPQLTKAVDGHYIPLYTGLHGLGVNEKLLKEKNLPVPETWKDLGDPKYKGLIAMPNPNTSGTGYLLMTTLVQLYGDDAGFELLEGHPQERRPVHAERRRSEPPRRTGRGRHRASSFANDVVERVRKGFPIRFVAPKDGIGYEIGALGLVKGAPNRERTRSA